MKKKIKLDIQKDGIVILIGEENEKVSSQSVARTLMNIGILMGSGTVEVSPQEFDDLVEELKDAHREQAIPVFTLLSGKKELAYLTTSLPKVLKICGHGEKVEPKLKRQLADFMPKKVA